MAIARSRRTLVFACTTLFTASAAVTMLARQASGPSVAADTRPAPQDLIGSWIYNPTDSVNAATGRPEQAPRSATTRTVGRGGRGAGGSAPAPAGNPPAASSGGGSGTGGGRDGTGGDGPGGINSPMASGVVTGMLGRGDSVGMTPEMMRENRDLARDLLEVPEALTISVASAGVTFTDDLSRARTYPLDGQKRKYSLSAARYDAAMEWDGAQLKKHIEGPYGFRMTETYFLSADGRRLFVIVRVGDPKKNAPVVGFNRVYDRATP